jgi:hypothetical protein
MMKKFIILSFLLLSSLACKKNKFSPDGPTDVRIRNNSDFAFTEVTVSTSEKSGDTITFGNITNGALSDYYRFKKAYPKAEISAKIIINGSLIVFSTGPVDYTYMQYIGRSRISYEVDISNPTTHTLKISNVIEEEPLVLK